MLRIATLIRTRKGRTATPSMVMIDGQTVRGGRAGPTFHEKGGRGGRTNGAKRSIAIEILGLPLAVSVESARPHDVSAGRRLLATTVPELGTVQDVIADRGYRGLGKMAANNGLNLRIKAPPKGTSGFVPIAPLYRVEHAFARLGRWRRLSRCYEESAESARAWLEVASLGYLLARLRVEPA
jgi:putative transposase